MKTQQVEIKKIKKTKRYRIDLGNIEELAASIKEKGQLVPLLLSEDLTLLAGERRLTAMESLKWDKVTAFVLAAEGELEQREIELLENVMRKDMRWDERAMLEARIFQLRSESDPNWSQRDQAGLLDASAGAVNRRLQLAEAIEIIPELADAKTEDEAWKKYKRLEEDAVNAVLLEKAEKTSKGIAKWARDHYILGDSVTQIKKMNPDVCDFAEVDPPYGIDLDKRREGRTKSHSEMTRYIEIPTEEYPKFLHNIATEVYRVLRKNSYCVWWYGMSWHQQVYDTLTRVGFTVNPIPAIWTKGQAGQTAAPETALGSSYEPFFVARKGKPKLMKEGRSNVFQFQPVPHQKKDHSTEKPIELMLEILETFTWPGSTTIVPFLGSGVTLRAGYRIRRKGLGFDLDEMIRTRFLANIQKDVDAGTLVN